MTESMEAETRTIERADLEEVAAKVRDHFERNARNGGEHSPLLDDNLIGQVLYVVNGSGYAVVRSEDLRKASNFRSALKAFLD